MAPLAPPREEEAQPPREEQEWQEFQHEWLLPEPIAPPRDAAADQVREPSLEESGESSEEQRGRRIITDHRVRRNARPLSLDDIRFRLDDDLTWFDRATVEAREGGREAILRYAEEHEDVARAVERESPESDGESSD